MIDLFDVTIRYQKVLENGTQKMVGEVILFHAMSFTEAEAKAIEYIRNCGIECASITAIKFAKFDEEVLGDQKPKKYYAAKHIVSLINEVTGKSKRKVFNWLIQAESLNDAKEIYEHANRDSVLDAELGAIIETKYSDCV